MKSTIKEDKDKPPVGCFVRTVVYRPCLVCFVSAFIALVFVALAGTSAALKLGASWVDYGDMTVKQVFAFQKANAEIREAMQSADDSPGTSLCNAERQSRSISGRDVSFYLRSKSKDVLSTENMKAHQYIISEWQKLSSWNSFCRLRKLEPSTTESEEPLSLFRAVEIDNIGEKQGTGVQMAELTCNTCRASYGQAFKCPNLAMVRDMQTPASLQESPLTRAQMEPYMESLCDVSETDKNTLCEMQMRKTRSTLVSTKWDCDTFKAEYSQIVFRTGYPFEDSRKDNPDLCKSTTEDNSTYPEKLREFFVATYASNALEHTLKIIKKVEEDYPDLTLAFNAPGNFEYIWLVLWSDVAFVGISLVLVAVVLVVQTGSVFVMLTGIFEILVSFPIAAFVWFGIFQQKGITNLMFIGVFVILGIGADDIFVYVDAWKQSALEDPSISGSYETRFAWAYRRASKYKMFFFF
jgi:hypothetical protein